MLQIEDKIKGCLYGAVIGTELGMQRILTKPSMSAAEMIDLFNSGLKWQEAPPQPQKRVGFVALTPLLASVARAYIKKNGRITPEDWAAELKTDPGISENEAFWLIDVHSTIELLREGMNPRLSGIGAVPTGNISAAIAPVGIYHAGDPEGAYLDAVEVASVTQRSPAVEWAAVAAAAIAEALKPTATVQSVIDNTLKIAHHYNKDVFYEINHIYRQASRSLEDYLPYYAHATTSEYGAWVGHNPIGWALALMRLLGNSPDRLITLSALGAYPSIRASVAGAIVGALNGKSSLPADWVNAVEAEVKPMLGIIDVVHDKIRAESVIVKDIEEVAKPLNDGNSLLFDKIYGCILAGAIGNAMGSVVEGKFYWEIDEEYPDGITTVLDPSRLEGEDDNQMAALLFETYIERNGFPASARDFGNTWKHRLNRDHFFYCMKNSYDLIREGMDPRIAGHWSMVTGSTVMCMEPVGVYNLCDPKNAYIDATAISYMYQRGLDVTAAAILAASVAEALNPHATVDSVLKAALNVAPKEKMLTFDTRKIDTPYDFISTCLEVADKYNDVLAARKELYEKCLYYHMIDPLELLGLSYAMLKISKGDVRLAAIGGTNIGRDSDTIAGRAAMLAGTLRGAGNVPKEWIDLMKPESLQRIRNNAQRISDFIADIKLPYMKLRQNLIAR